MRYTVDFHCTYNFTYITDSITRMFYIQVALLKAGKREKSKMKKENIWSLRSENVIKTTENGFAQKEYVALVSFFNYWGR